MSLLGGRQLTRLRSSRSASRLIDAKHAEIQMSPLKISAGASNRSDIGITLSDLSGQPSQRQSQLPLPTSGGVRTELCSVTVFARSAAHCHPLRLQRDLTSTTVVRSPGSD